MANEVYHGHRLEYYKKNLGEMTYGEVVSMIEQADQFIHDMGPFDPAVDHFYRQREEFQNYADCYYHCEPNNEAYKAHLVEKLVLYSIRGGETQETVALVPKWYKEGQSDYRIRLASQVYDQFPHIDRRDIEIVIL